MEEVYEAFAWVGLIETSTFIEKIDDEQDLIKNTITNEIKNFEILAKGEPCN